MFQLHFKVRDYECDLQGIVNNANYQHYLEHARHEYLQSLSIDFAGLHAEGTDLIVSRIEIDYKLPLRSRDEFTVSVLMKKEGNVRVLFEQEIRTSNGNKLAASAKVYGVCLVKGRPVAPGKIFGDLFGTEH
ncbi:MAG: acyl-CoA thioesterase [Bacteroidales bacterium]